MQLAYSMPPHHVRTGGIGVIGGLMYNPKMLRQGIDDLKSQLEDKDAPFGVDLAIPQVGGGARKTNVRPGASLPQSLPAALGRVIYICPSVRLYQRPAVRAHGHHHRKKGRPFRLRSRCPSERHGRQASRHRNSCDEVRVNLGLHTQGGAHSLISLIA